MRNIWCALPIIAGICTATEVAIGSDCDIDQVYTETTQAVIRDYKVIDKQIEHFPQINGGKCIITGMARVGSSWYQDRGYAFWTEDLSLREACDKASERVKTNIAVQNRPLVVRSKTATRCRIIDGKIVKKPNKQKWTWNECRQFKHRPWWGYNYPDPCKEQFRQLDDGRRKGYPPSS